MNRRLAVLVTVLLGVACLAFYLRCSQTSSSGESEYSKLLQTIAQDLGKGVQSKTKLIERALYFVNHNSIHQEDEEQRRYGFNTPLVIRMLYDVHTGASNEKPHLTCGPRALAMRSILAALGVVSRLVQVYSSDYQIVRAHRVLEVLNPDTDRWEVWDPDYGVVYTSKSDDTRVDIMRLVFKSLDEVEPRGKDCHDWSECGMNEIKLHYFQAVLFERMEGGMHDAPIILNRARLNKEKIFEDGNTFERWARKNYGAPRLIEWYP